MKFQFVPLAALFPYFLILFKLSDADYPFLRRMSLIISAILNPD
jgi:hypothetical protein